MDQDGVLLVSVGILISSIHWVRAVLSIIDQSCVNVFKFEYVCVSRTTISEEGAEMLVQCSEFFRILT